MADPFVDWYAGLLDQERLGTTAPIPDDYANGVPWTPSPEDLQDPSQLQPGLGVPTTLVDDALASPQEQPQQLQPGLGGVPAQLVDDAFLSSMAQQNNQPGPLEFDQLEPVDSPALLQPLDISASSENGIGPMSPIGAVGTAADEAAQRLNESPEKYTRRLAIHEQAAKDKAAIDEANALAERRRQLEDDHRVRTEADAMARQKSDAIYADAAELAKRQINPDRRGIGQRLVDVIAVIAGGIGAVSTGGRNIGLELVQRSIDADVAAQQADLANAWKGLDTRKGAVAELYARNRDANAAADSYRLSLWDQVSKELATQKNNFDPRGSAALRIEGTERLAAQKRAEIAAKIEERNAKIAAEAANKKLEDDKFAEEKRKTLEDEKQKRAKISQDGWKIGADIKIADRTLKIAEAKLAPDLEKTQAEIDNLRGQGKDKEAKQLQDFGIPGIQIVAPDGTKKTFVATSGTPEDISKIRRKVARTNEALKLIDRIRTTRIGWSTSTGNSSEHQRLNTMVGQLNLVYKDINDLGQLTGGDEGLIQSVRGFDSATGYKDFEDGIVQSRENILRSANEDLKSVGGDGKWDVADIQANKDATQEGDKDIARVLKSPSVKDSEYVQSTNKTMNDLEKASLLQDPRNLDARRAAIEQLDMISKTADDPAMRESAAWALKQAAAQSFESIPTDGRRPDVAPVAVPDAPRAPWLPVVPEGE